MVYRRRSRKRVRRRRSRRPVRRRRFKRRRKQSTTRRRWKDWLADQKRMYGVRKFFTETRNGNDSIAVDRNVVRFSAHACMGCPAVDRSYIAGVLGQSGQELGSPDHGGTDDMKVDSTATDIKKVLIYEEKQTVHLRNVSLNPVHCKVYEIVAKRNISSTDSSYNDAREIALHDFAIGLKEDMATGTATTSASTVYEGDEIIEYTPGNKNGTTRSAFMGPNSSTRFRQNWKVAKFARYKLSPGDEVFWKMKVKDHIYDPAKDLTGNGSVLEDARHVRKGLTKLLLIFVHGSMGAKTDDVNTVGYLSVHMTVDLVQSAKVMPINFEEPEKSFQVLIDKDDDTLLLVGPTHHSDAADEA